MVKTLQANGIRVLGSSIIGLENHRPETMDQVIADAVAHAADFHQFMLYTPVPGTPLHAQHTADGTLMTDAEMPPADAHGQYRFNYRHPHIKAGEEERFLRQAFETDFKVNGPSLARLIRTQLTGWRQYRNHADPRVAKRIRNEAAPLRGTYAAAVWAMRKWYARDPRMASRLNALLKDLYKSFGLKTRLIAPLLGRFLHITIKREARRLADGWTYEPNTFYEKNPAALALEANPGKAAKKHGTTIGWVTCKAQPARP